MVTVNETLVRDILDRLIRLEALAEGQNQRIGDLAEQVRETNRRIDGLAEEIRETNRRIDGLAEEIRETNRRIDGLSQSVSQRIDETNVRTDTQTENLRREFRSDFNRQTFLILGFGAALIASVVTTSIFG